MSPTSLIQKARKIHGKDSRYEPEAYVFVQQAMHFTKEHIKQADSKDPHITGQQLVEGIRRFALQEFGPMAITVFKTWGINKTEDIGEIVFNLIEYGDGWSKKEEDKKEDFSKGYDFFESFASPFLPSSEKKNAMKKSKSNKKRRSS